MDRIEGDDVDWANVASRFWPKVALGLSDECWEWTAYRKDGVRGQFCVKPSTAVSAHRVAWRLSEGVPIPDGLCVLHTCDNAACCNPAHLYLGTQTQNMQDKAMRERMSWTHLTRAQAQEIRSRYALGGESYGTLAREFKCRRDTVYRIVKNRTYRDYSQPRL